MTFKLVVKQETEYFVISVTRYMINYYLTINHY